MQLRDDIIVITAAGTGSWLREKFTPGGWARMFGESLISDYKEKMQILRQVDDKIFDWSKDLDNIVKELQRAFKASRLLDVALLIGELNKKLNNIQIAGAEVKQIAEKAIKEFESERETTLAADDMIVEAGAWSDFKREWVAKRLETKERKVRNLAIKTVIDKADLTVKKVQKYVKELGRARAEGNIGQYLVVLRLIADEQKSFANTFLPVYKKYLNNMVEKALQDEKEEQKIEIKEPVESTSEPMKIAPFVPEKTPEKTLEVKAPVVEEAVKKNPADLGVLEMPKETVETPNSVNMDRPEPVTESMPGDKVINSIEPVTVPVESDAVETVNVDSRLENLSPEGAEKAEPEKEEEEKSPETVLSSGVVRAGLRGNHAKFVECLQKLAEHNDPGLLVKAILDYSEVIENTDLNSSLKLLAIAEGILDESR